MTRSLFPLLACLALTACPGEIPSEGTPVEVKAHLNRFADCGELREYLSGVMLETLLSHQYGWGWGVPEADGSYGDSGGGPSDYTTTNVQEEGVDEVDIVKTDGLHIYTVQDGALHILKTWPVEETEKLATVELDGWASGLFLHEDLLVVFEYIWDDFSGMGRSWGGTRISFLDVADRSEPVVLRTLDLEGYMADARMIDGHVYMVANHYMYLPQDLWDLLWGPDAVRLPEVDWTLSGDELQEDMERKRAMAREILRPHVARTVADLDLREFLPQWRDSDTDRVTDMYMCEDIYRPAQESRFNMLSVVHLDLDGGSVGATGLMSDGWTIYSSLDNLYVAQTSWWSWWGLGDLELQSYIHRFHLGDGEDPVYTGTGVVDGWLYDQFAMSEYEGHLRVATTDFDWWWGTGEGEDEGGSNIFVLTSGEADLEVVGEVRGIAPGERIMAARMIGDTGYIVTFRQTDPLFTLDLSDPTEPVIMGELHMPGYSAYLHPMEDGWLLAVGMDGTEDGVLTGLAVNVFDVRDLTEPILAHQYTLPDEGWTWSEALWDHHAFTYHRGVLSIPAYSYEWEGNSYDYFSGVIAFSASTEGVSELGRVDHRSLVEESECLYSMWYDYDSSVCDDWAWYASVRRTVYIEDNLYSVSNYGVKVNDLEDPSVEHGSVPFFPR